MMVKNFQKLQRDGKKWLKHVAVEVILMSNFLLLFSGHLGGPTFV
jgi:hypothetical protein